LEGITPIFVSRYNQGVLSKLNKMTYLHRGFRWARANIPFLILGIAVTFQLIQIFQGYVPKTFNTIWQERSRPAVWRSASILFDTDYAEYIEFVKANVPEDGLVMIPKEDQVWDFGNVGLMQYFLYPRQIADCPIESLEECILNLKGPKTYILAPDATFPPREVADQVKRFIPFEGDRGLYVPPP
jgi:hypothetical protein